MKAVEFTGQSVVLGPPPGFNDAPGQVKCGGLPIRHGRDIDGTPVLQSMWRPSADELAALADGACICLSIWGRGHPPVAIDVERVEVLP